MRKSTKSLIALVSVITLFAFAIPAISNATDVPQFLNYQGYLTNSSGQPVSGSHQIVFKLYNGFLSGGTSFWTETQPAVQVTDGRFSVVLGKITPLDTTQFTGSTYIGITVDTNAEMAPRQQFTSVAYALKAADAIPKGLIAMWSGASNAIPAGWAICDGTNGTPDLRDRFVIGAGHNYPVNAADGHDSHTLSINEMPSHNHGGVTGADGANHTHSGTTGFQNQNATHSHTMQVGINGDKGDSGSSTLRNYGSWTPFTTNVANTDHTHYFTTDTASANHTHTISSQGGGQSFSILPPYYALAFIMKL